ncbi:hypothetical protein H4R19_001680 [Coemansia spiralis]|nr:hypothetical protein H4R19_001680 [Coemansia spiralis]
MAPLYVPSKRRFAVSDAFFGDGNAEASVHRHISADHVRAFVDRVLGDAAAPIVCRDAPCHGSVVCPSTHAFEKHYDQVHRNSCGECGAVLPSAHWLDLHIQECHDAYFGARVARGEKPYQCFLRACTRTFARPYKRRLHMVDKHHFAASFDWGLVRTGLRRPGGGSTSSQPGRAAAQREPRPAAAATAAVSSAEAMDVDRLASAFTRSLSVGVPRSVSFGRRRTTGRGYAP